MSEQLLAIDPGAHTLNNGNLSTVFLPGHGMLCATLKHRGEELLGRLDDIALFAKTGRTCGIPLLYPWANRLGASSYDAAGKHVVLDGTMQIGHDDNGLPIHVISWTHLPWRLTEASGSALKARLDWAADNHLAVFPFPHRVEMDVTLSPDALSIQTTVYADQGCAVPVSFGFHPYFRLEGLATSEWLAHVPAMSHLLLDEKNIPTGEETPEPSCDLKLGGCSFDDEYALLDPHSYFSITGHGRRLTIEFVEGFPYAQVYEPKDKDFIAIEPMTAPINALVSGQGLRVIEPGEQFSATFRVNVTEI